MPVDNSLVLSHLSWHLAQHRALKFVFDADEPPPLRDIADALCKEARSPRKVWEAIDQASRQAELSLKAMRKLNIFSVSYWSPHYPHALRLIENPPWNLFYTHKLPQASIPTIAIVGSRKPNQYGCELLASIIPHIVSRPLQVISGLAYGIDALAHFHACQAAIPNWAVMGCGLDVLYPSDHSELAASIIKSGGGLLSEFPPGTAPAARNFPRRNRIIAGLSNYVWIVQGTAKSGTVHTLDHALKQGKPILAVPGDIFSELSELPNRLLYDGATMLLQASDIDLILQAPRAIVTH